MYLQACLALIWRFTQYKSSIYAAYPGFKFSDLTGFSDVIQFLKDFRDSKTHVAVYARIWPWSVPRLQINFLQLKSTNQCQLCIKALGNRCKKSGARHQPMIQREYGAGKSSSDWLDRHCWETDSNNFFQDEKKIYLVNNKRKWWEIKQIALFVFSPNVFVVNGSLSLPN